MTAFLVMFGLLAALSGAVGYGLYTQAGFEVLPSAGAGLAVFTIFLSLWSLAKAHKALSQIRLMADPDREFEADILRRIDELYHRTGGGNAGSPAVPGLIEERLSRLEASLFESPAQPRPAGPGFADRETGSSENIIRLDPAARRNDAPQPTPAEAPVQAVTQPAIRLQPVVQLPAQTTVGFEAIAHCGKNPADPPLAGFKQSLELGERLALELESLMEVGRVIRFLEREGVALPVFAAISGALVSDAGRWTALEQRLEADALFASRLVLNLPFRDFRALDAKARSRLIGVTAHGVNLCVSGLRDEIDLRQIEATDRFAYAAITVERLLASSTRDNSPGYQRMRPVAEALNLQLLATDVEKAHHVAGLIDADILTCQGDFLATPRRLRLYSEAPAGLAAGN